MGTGQGSRGTAVSAFRTAFLDAATFGVVSLARFEEAGECVVHELTDAAELPERLAGRQCVVVNKFVLDRERLEHPSARGLRLVAVGATGTDNVDVGCARELGVAVCNVPGYAAAAVAQFTLALILELATRAARYAQDTRMGHWQESTIFTRHDYPSFELRGRVLGIVGYGAIGRKVAETARVLGMTVVLADRVGDHRRRPGRLPLEEMLGQADFVSLHCPLTPLTAGLVNRRTLALMKPAAYLVNTARGGLVDEAALIEALEQGRLGGAALDVISQEPPDQGHPMMAAAARLDNLLVTPHCAWAAREARQRLMDEVFENVRAFRRGRRRNRVD